jgi:hypothetical protein
MDNLHRHITICNTTQSSTSRTRYWLTARKLFNLQKKSVLNHGLHTSKPFYFMFVSFCKSLQQQWCLNISTQLHENDSVMTLPKCQPETGVHFRNSQVASHFCLQLHQTLFRKRNIESCQERAENIGFAHVDIHSGRHVLYLG